jgi:hypothetical protein
LKLLLGLSSDRKRAAEQSLAADRAIACFSSNFFQLSLNADRAPQLKTSVMFLLLNQKRFLATIFLVFLIATVSQAQKRRLTEAEAIKLAEQFIAQNGYSDLPPNKTKIAYETIEWESNAHQMLKERHDTLQRKAYGVVRGRKAESAGWTVVFRYKHPADREERSLGRAVTMNLDGSDTRVEHVDFILKYARRRP